MSAFLLDFDGTLFDSKESFILAYNMALSKYSLPPLPRNESDAMQLLRKPADAILPAILGGQSSDPSLLKSFISDLKACYGSVYLEHTLPCPMAVETVRQLNALDLKVAVVSSRRSFTGFIRPLLAKHGVDSMVDPIITSLDVVKTKPSPEPFLLAACRLGIRPNGCVVVGDSPEDVLGGKAAGMLTVAYTGGFYSFEELSKYGADIITGNISDLVKLAKEAR